MSTNTIAPILPQGAGYGVVVGIGVSFPEFYVHNHLGPEYNLTDTSSSLPFLWRGFRTYR
jgi:hypothetical protein